jgi:hypothetical protein
MTTLLLAWHELLAVIVILLVLTAVFAGVALVCATLRAFARWLRSVDRLSVYPVSGRFDWRPWESKMPSLNATMVYWGRWCLWVQYRKGEGYEKPATAQVGRRDGEPRRDCEGSPRRLTLPKWIRQGRP